MNYFELSGVLPPWAYTLHTLSRVIGKELNRRMGPDRHYRIKGPLESIPIYDAGYCIDAPDSIPIGGVSIIQFDEFWWSIELDTMERGS